MTVRELTIGTKLWLAPELRGKVIRVSSDRKHTFVTLSSGKLVRLSAKKRLTESTRRNYLTVAA